MYQTNGWVALPFQGRIKALDRFRGFAIAMMIAFGAAKMFADTDFFVQLSSHDLTESFQLIAGFGFYDVIAPLFVFASGLSFSVSHAVAVKKIGAVAARKKALLHGLEVIGIGALVSFDFSPLGIFCFSFMPICLTVFILSFVLKKHGALLKKILRLFLICFGGAILLVNMIETVLYSCSVAVYTDVWGALCSIGLGMLVCTTIADLPKILKIAFCYLYLLVYGGLCLVLPQSVFADFVHGGVLGGFGYAALFLLAEVLMSIKEDRWVFWLFVLSIYLSAFVCAGEYDCSKAAVNLSYVLVSFAFAASFYSVFEGTEEIPYSFFALTTLGKNALTAYCLHFAMTFTYGICLNALVAYLPMKGAIQIVLYAVGMILYVYIMAIVLRALSKRSWTVKLS